MYIHKKQHILITYMEAFDVYAIMINIKQICTGYSPKCHLGRF